MFDYLQRVIVDPASATCEDREKLRFSCQGKLRL